MGNLSVIGKVHIKDINALREWHASGDFKKWLKVNPNLPLTIISNWKIPTRSHFTRCRTRFLDFPRALTGQAHG